MDVSKKVIPITSICIPDKARGDTVDSDTSVLQECGEMSGGLYDTGLALDHCPDSVVAPLTVDVLKVNVGQP